MRIDHTSVANYMNPASEYLLRSPVSHLREKYDAWEILLGEQSASTKRILMAQAGILADAIVKSAAEVQFQLPEMVVIELLSNGRGEIGYVPPHARDQIIGGIINTFVRGNFVDAIRQRLAELEHAPNRAIATSAGLLRHAMATYMVRDLIPSGRSVVYTAEEGEEIPSIPVHDDGEKPAAMMARTDAIAEDSFAGVEFEELLVPYVRAARRHFLPYWVVFDDQDRLLADSIATAEARIASMQHFVRILHTAVSLAPYMVADSQYQRKRNGMLGQLVNQGRAYGRYQTSEVIHEIQRRVAAHDLNRGLSIQLPYFDDQALEVKEHTFVVIPAGMIMFVPALLVRACEQEMVKVAQDTRLNHSTRRHLLNELKELADSYPNLA